MHACLHMCCAHYGGRGTQVRHQYLHTKGKERDAVGLAVEACMMDVLARPCCAPGAAAPPTPALQKLQVIDCTGAERRIEILIVASQPPLSQACKM